MGGKRATNSGVFLEPATFDDIVTNLQAHRGENTLAEIAESIMHYLEHDDFLD